MICCVIHISRRQHQNHPRKSGTLPGGFYIGRIRPCDRTDETEQRKGQTDVESTISSEMRGKAKGKPCNSKQIARLSWYARSRSVKTACRGHAVSFESLPVKPSQRQRLNGSDGKTPIYQKPPADAEGF